MRSTLLKSLLAAALVVAALDALYVLYLWPDWRLLETGPAPKSRFIELYEDKAAADAALPRLRWTPVSMAAIPAHLRRAVVVAEDARFFQHNGFDWEAIYDAARHNFTHERLQLGGSTISQQTAKNLFLHPSRSWLRKWHELVLTWGLESHLSKKRILLLYLNVAEFGPGIYGVEAAARHYWKISAAQLSPHQSIELAATLPSPLNHNPLTRTKRFLHRRAKIAGFLASTHEAAEQP